MQNAPMSFFRHLTLVQTLICLFNQIMLITQKKQESDSSFHYMFLVGALKGKKLIVVLKITRTA